ncbi:hypothetical protein O181_099233 [Austropuccinia psidii MF-1]|uniref:Uncharacterized protein n=1 Tax=Austropuccinia psidii MF-1 TaxID=1389203 RepID=A0A9Q3PEY0_9BASI|nr:hypothetical protein [Austropuccinia psidii MF-1]
MEFSSHLPQLSNGQLDLSKVQDAQLMKTKPNRGKGYTAGNSCITEVVIDNKPTKLLLDPGAFCSCVPNCEDQPPGQILYHLLAIDFTSHRASRQRQLSYVSHENVTQSPNPFQHYSQRSGHFT